MARKGVTSQGGRAVRADRWANRAETVCGLSFPVVAAVFVDAAQAPVLAGAACSAVFTVLAVVGWARPRALSTRSSDRLVLATWLVFWLLVAATWGLSVPGPIRVVSGAVVGGVLVLLVVREVRRHRPGPT